MDELRLSATLPAEPGHGGRAVPGVVLADDPELARGADIGRYVVLTRLGAGGMGVVYAAYDPELDRKVAVKLLHSGLATASASDEQRTRLLREAHALARLSHPNVVTIHDIGTREGKVWIAMEHVQGRTLEAWRREAPRGWSEVLAVMLAAGRGLVAAHQAGLVHRDLKPENIMLDVEGRVRVMDFGLARPVREAASASPSSQPHAPTALTGRLTQAGALVGTPAYMAPEQFAGRATDALTDQYAFAVTLWELLYGSLPFAGDTLVVLADNVTAGRLAPPNRAGVPAWLRRIVVRGLSVEPTRRFPTLAAMIDALERGKVRARRRVLLSAAAIVAVLAGGVVAGSWAADERGLADGSWRDTSVGEWSRRRAAVASEA
jgi:serine/threonine protein kinase